MWVIEEHVRDGMWKRIAPLLPLPKPPAPRSSGRRSIDDQAPLARTVFVPATPTILDPLPTTLVDYSGTTCWRRRRARNEAGVWPALYAPLLDRQCPERELDRQRSARLWPPGAEVEPGVKYY